MAILDDIRNFLGKKPVSPIPSPQQPATTFGQNLLKQVQPAINFVQQNPTPAVFVNQQFQTKIAQPFATGLRSAGQAYINAVPAAAKLSPPGQLINSYQNFRDNTNPMQNLQTQGMNVVKASPLVFGAAGGVNMARQGLMGAAKTVLPNALLGGGISKFTGGSFLQGVGQGVGAAPQVGGVTQFSNPLINRAVGKFTGNIQNPLVNNLAGRAATGVLNIPEGAVINSALGRPSYGVGEAAMDFATGALLGNGKAANAKGFDVGRNRFSRWMKDDVYKVEEVADTLYQNKKLTPELIEKLDKDVTYLARAYLPTSTIEKIANDYGSNSRGFIKATVEELQKSLKSFEDRTGAFTLGITGDQLLRRNRHGSYTNVPEIDNPLVKKTQGFEAEMDQLAKETKIDLDNLKPKKVVIQEKAVKVPSDQQTKDTASLIGGAMGKPSNDVQDAFANWVNARKASKIEGIVKGREFQDLNDKGIQGVFDFQKGDVKGNRLGYDSRFREVKKYFDQKYELLKDTGIDLNYKKDYLPQLWKNTPEEVDQTFRKLGLKPSFTIDSVFKNYQEGIAAGLTPKFNNIGDLVTWYEQRANKALADRKFFEFMGGQGMILPRGEAPKDWVTLDPDRFPNITMKTDMGVFTGDYKAPPEIAQMINNYLGAGEDKAIAGIANAFSKIKNRVLSAGIPFTGINAHGHNVLIRNTLANKNPIMGFIQGANWLVRPRVAEEFINKNLGNAAEAVRYGLKMDVEDNVFKQIEKDPTTFLGKVDKAALGYYDRVFGDPLFQKALPAMKLNYYQQLFDEFKQSMTTEAAGKRAAQVANDMFGGINWEQWGRNRNMQNFFRSVVLAPDWLESTLRIGKGVLDVNNPAGKAYRRFAANFGMSLIGLSLLNKHLSGKWLWENEPGQEFNLDTGTYTEDGKKRYIRIYGTGADMFRIPLEAAAGLAKGDPTKVFQSIRNRMSIPISTGMNLLNNTNYLGQPLYGKDRYGNELTAAQSAGGVVGELSSLIAPTQIRAFIDLISGRNNMEQTVAQAFELPIRYKQNFLSPSKQELEKIAKQEGLSGKELYEFNKSLKGESALGKNQLEEARAGGVQTIKDIYEERRQKREQEKNLKAEEEGVTQKQPGLLESFFPSRKAGAAERYEESPEAPKTIPQKVLLAAQGIGVDPQNTIKAIFTEERMRKISGNAMILERKQYLNQTPDNTDAVDHIVPLALGGTNDPSNLRYISKEANSAKAKLETKLAKELKEGKITKEEARKQVKEWVETYESKPADMKASLMADVAQKSTDAKAMREYKQHLTGKKTIKEIDSHLKQYNTTTEELDLKIIKSLNTPEQAEHVYRLMKTDFSQEKFAKFVNDGLLTDSIAKQFYDTNKISKDQYDALKIAIKEIKTGKKTEPKKGRKKKLSGIKFDTTIKTSKIKPLKFKRPSTYRAPVNLLSAPKLKALSFKGKPLKFKKPRVSL